MNKSLLILFLATMSYYCAYSQSVNQNLFGETDSMYFSFKGDIYFLPENTKRLPDDFSKLEKQGTIYTNKLDIPETPFSKGFPGITDRFEWFAIDYNGFFFITDSGEYAFQLTSDDGARLLIDGECLISIDGLHSVISKTGSLDLTPGLHSVTVEYFQGPRQFVALQLHAAKMNEELEPLVWFKFLPMEVEEDDEKIILTLSDDVLFDYNSFILRNETKDVLKKVYFYLLKDQLFREISVTGHTDNRGSADYNNKLSLKRAKSVKNFLIQCGLNNTVVTTYGQGESMPAHENDTEENRFKNRRVEIALMK